MSLICDFSTIQHVQAHLGIFHACTKYEMSAYMQAAFEEGRPEIIDCPMCNNFIGIAYLYGEGINQDKKKGIDFLQKACDLGLAKAMYNMYLEYKEGDNIAQDLTLALKYCEKSAKLGDADAQIALEKIQKRVKAQGMIKKIEKQINFED